MLLYLIRHGESLHNAEGRIQGQSDVPLSELGERQSAAVAAALHACPLEAVYASPLSRALETARPLAADHGLTVQTDPRLMELHAGVFQDHLRSELMGEYGAELACWLGGDEDFVIPGGESRRQLAARGSEVLREIAAAGHTTAAVVTHGGLLSATLRSLLSLPQAVPPFSLQNGSITKISADAHGTFLLLALGETNHLQAVGESLGQDL